MLLRTTGVLQDLALHDQIILRGRMLEINTSAFFTGGAAGQGAAAAGSGREDCGRQRRRANLTAGVRAVLQASF